MTQPAKAPQAARHRPHCQRRRLLQLQPCCPRARWAPLPSQMGLQPQLHCPGWGAGAALLGGTVQPPLPCLLRVGAALALAQTDLQLGRRRLSHGMRLGRRQVGAWTRRAAPAGALSSCQVQCMQLCGHGWGLQQTLSTACLAGWHNLFADSSRPSWCPRQCCCSPMQHCIGRLPIMLATACQARSTPGH